MSTPEKPAASTSADDFRSAMRRWPSGVTVITMLDGEERHGMTASAFTSVSISPPLILVVIDRRWRSHDLIDVAGAFCVNILDEDALDRSDRFAGRHGKMEDRFFDIETRSAVTGAPVMADALAWLDCEIDQRHPAGDHTIFVGRVVACAARDDAASGPLIYHEGGYARIASEPRGS